MAEFLRPVPGHARRGGEIAVGAIGGVQRHRQDGQSLVAAADAVRRAPVVADHPPHRLAVGLEAGKGAHFARHLGRGGVGGSGHDRRDGGANGATLRRVVGNAGGHQVAADVGVAQAQRAEFVGQLGDPGRREMRHHHRDFENHGPQPDRVLEPADVEARALALERQQIQRGEVARGVVEEHVLRARVRGVDPPRFRAGVPLVDGGVVLQSRIGAGPGGVRDLLPQLARLDALGDAAVVAPDQRPLGVVLDFFEEGIGDADGVVGILSADGEVGFRIPVGVHHREIDVGETLARELDHPLDVVVGNHGLARAANGALQRRLAGGLETIVAGQAVGVAGGHDLVQVLVSQLRSRHQGGDSLFFPDFPVDELLDVGVIDVDHHHLGGAARGAARLDGAGGAVADLQERHQAGRAAAARQSLAIAAQRREIRAGAGAVFEQARLAHPQVHDAAFVDQIVGDRLDEAGVRLRMLVGRFRFGQLAALEIDVVVALARPVDAIGPVQAGVEPLRRIGRAHLRRQHGAQLVEEGLRVGLVVEIAALPAPIGPGAGQAIEHLLGAMFADQAFLLGQEAQRLLVGDRAPQERGHRILFHLLQAGRHAGLAEIFLRQHVGGDLRPEIRHFDVVELEHHRAVRVADFAGGEPELQACVGRLCILGVAPFNPHVSQAP